MKSDHVTMLVHNSLVLSAMTFAIWYTRSLWPLVLLFGLVGVKDDKGGSDESNT